MERARDGIDDYLASWLSIAGARFFRASYEGITGALVDYEKGEKRNFDVRSIAGSQPS